MTPLARLSRRRPAPARAEIRVHPAPEPQPPPVTGRVCLPCAVTWRSADVACWVCGRPGELASNVNVW